MLLKTVLLILLQLVLCAVESAAFDERELIQGKKTLFISLGPSCEAALRIQDCGLRYAAFPFDWLILKKVDRFIELLDNDFQFFLDDEYLAQMVGFSTRCKNDYYEIFFIHDLPFSDVSIDAPINFTEALPAIKAKYLRRIERFRALNHYPGKVFFFRTFWFEEGNYLNSQQAQDIKNALARYFPLLNFTLVVFNYTDSNSPPITNIEGVIEFKVRREKNIHDWQVMCQTLLNL